MAEKIHGALIHCRQLLKQYDYQNFLCSTFLPLELQKFKWALGAFNIETARIKTTSSQPGLGAARIQFWRDCLSTVLAYLKTRHLG